MESHISLPKQAPPQCIPTFKSKPEREARAERVCWFLRDAVMNHHKASGLKGQEFIFLLL